MSDEELLHKQQNLMMRLAYASRFSGSDIISRLDELLRAVEFERNERVLKQMIIDRSNMFPDIIESEPDLRVSDEKAKEASEKKITPQPRPRIAVTRTTRPVTPTPDDNESNE